MADPVDRNRLAETHSPYLHQHADNPVHWQPWDETALDAAESRDVPIFLSIGYAACHWCHVMEEESFQNEDIAATLNEHFVPIKVDREERPELDRIYQTISQLVTGGGGWPLSVWLTPDGRPFYVGTYFPPTAGRGRPGFDHVLERVSESWETDRDGIEERADQWREAIRTELEVTDSGPPETQSDRDELLAAADAARRSADPQHGGFGEHGPKFPQPRRIELLLTASTRNQGSGYLSTATDAIDAMVDRGLYDHLGGGFHRYATDRAWRVPHFEKMLYDNAEIPRTVLAGYQRTGRDRYATVVDETIAYLARELRHPDGGFYSTLDAQSGGREGAFYVWTPAGVRDALDDDELASLVCKRFGITEEGNFEGGTTVLALEESIDELADDVGKSPASVRQRLERAKDDLRTARGTRERPRRDEKILAGWNGLAISMLAEAGLVLDDDYVTMARESLAFVKTHHWNDDDQQLWRRYMEGDVGIAGYLEDYAALSRASFDVYQATGELDHLSFALALARAMIDRFWDPDTGTLYYTDEATESPVARPQDLTDQSVPSSLGLALDVLLTLAPFTVDESFTAIVEATLGTHRSRITGAPLQHPSLVLAENRFRQGGVELTISAESVPDPWRVFVAETYLPGRILTRRPPTDSELTPWLDELGLDETPPIWSGRTQQGNEATAYVCRDFTCSPPLTDVEDAEDWVSQFVIATSP